MGDTKRTSDDPSKKRLAIETEDHPLDYADFEGEIEEGNYGASEVELWDKGTYEIIEWKDNKIILDINGKRLDGKYVMIRFKPNEEPQNWLFFKKKKTE